MLIYTHSKKDNEQQWKQEWGYAASFCSHTSHSRGIAILFNNTFKYTLHKEIMDKNGNYFILDITIQDYRFSLVALYGPNDDCPVFFENIKKILTELSNSSIIMGGDWNVVEHFDLTHPIICQK